MKTAIKLQQWDNPEGAEYRSEKVLISIAGKLIDEDNPLGGEGLILSQPLTRSQFAVDFFLAP